MNRALRAAATGMYAQELQVEIISNNLANVNTTGFKKTRAEFQDLMYERLKTTGMSDVRATEGGTELEVGSGVQVVATQKNFSQGDARPTGGPLDLMINGEGFFQVKKPDGSIAYTRDGSFKLSSDGQLMDAQGYLLDPPITIPADTASITIGTDGVVLAQVGNDSKSVEIGQLELAKFVNPAGLKSMGNNLFQETVASGTPLVAKAGSEGYGEIMQNTLEASNVDIVEEMVNMIVAQRSYELNSKTIKTAEDMEQMANGLSKE